MSIAFDSATQAGGSQTTLQTVSHSVGSISDGIVIAVVQYAQAISQNKVPTYGGNTMTLLHNYDFNGTTFGDTYFYYYLLGDVSSSTKDVVFFPSALGYVYPMVATYSGVHQTNPFGSTPTYATNTATGTSVTTTLTTTDDNAWLVGMGQAQAKEMTASTNTEKRTTTYGESEGYNWHVVLDTNSDQTPIGSKSMSVTIPASAKVGIIMAQLVPAVAASNEVKSVAGISNV